MSLRTNTESISVYSSGKQVGFHGCTHPRSEGQTIYGIINKTLVGPPARLFMKGKEKGKSSDECGISAKR